MINRFLEVMSLALLVMLTISTTFQVLNYQLLREVHQELRADRPAHAMVPGAQRVPAVRPAEMAPPAAAPSPPAPSTPAEPEAIAAAPVSPTSVEAPRPSPAPPSPAAPPSPDPPLPAPDPLTEAPPGTPEAESQAWSESGPLLQRIIDDLFSGRYEAVAARLTPDVAETLTTDVLRSATERVRARRGEPRPASEARLAEVIAASDGVRIFRVELVTARQETLLISISLTEDDRIKGLFVR